MKYEWLNKSVYFLNSERECKGGLRKLLIDGKIYLKTCIPQLTTCRLDDPDEHVIVKNDTDFRVCFAFSIETM